MAIYVGDKRYAPYIGDKRRRYMSSKKEQYMQDGLIFWLDGIDKGAIDGTWVDLIGGKVFTSNSSTYIEAVSNGFHFLSESGSTYVAMSNSTALVGNANWTMECACVADNAKGSASMFTSSNRGYGMALNGTYKFANGTNAWTTSGIKNGPVVLALGENIGVENGIQLTTKYGGIGQMTTSGFRVGSCQNKNHNFYGVIHSIRIYNRVLTFDEIVHNQRIDNKRFNLGLAI